MTAGVGFGEAAVLGLVQGLTEFLPISSSAHLRIVAKAAGWDDPGAAFTAVSQLGTETAVLLFFFKDIVAIVRTWALSLVRPALRSEPDARLGWLVIIGSIPIGILGLALQKKIDSDFRSLWVIATTLVLFGLVLGFADRTAREVHEITELSWRDGIIAGFAQALALIPGVSRSGGTISALLLLGYKRPVAARYSFLLAVPAVLASGLFEIPKLGGEDPISWGPTLLATGIAFAVGLAVIAWLLRYLATGSFLPFVIYRLGLGGVLLALLATGVITSST